MNLLPRGQLITVFAALSAAFVISYIDQGCLGVLLPTIVRDLNAETTVSWAATSTMIANTTAILLFLSDLLCGFAKTATELYVFRGFSGIATGGISALTMIIVSDIVTLRQRGKYQGILSSCVGIGNITGPFLAAAIIDHTTWRVLFWVIGPCAFVSLLVAYPTIPTHFKGGDYKKKLKQVDSLGILFIYVEWKISLLPMIPLRLFNSKVCTAIYVQILLSGCTYYAQLNFLPGYYQNVRGYSNTTSAALTIPLVLAQALTTNGPLLYFGYAMLTIGAAIQCGAFNLTIYPAVLVIALVLQGVGIGCTFQTTLVALQANSAKSDRAIIISVRGLIRSLGGAVGLAVASELLSNVLLNNIPLDLPPPVREVMQRSVYATPDTSSLSYEQKVMVVPAYMTAYRAVFIFFVPCMALSLAACLLIKDTGLDHNDEKVQEKTDGTDKMKRTEPENVNDREIARNSGPP
ncbi:major facilitator superfamily domain-containing protein [Lipomyces tetrasporus]|uniref:Major facilitator superfamily domain-containing protein n=1 Tax=Lipomyces tetrasporus TaxID=54092 RepID=A0AAD7VVN6_9ASCO|nr:major facilitator superfamily domain-containing protein [Lipomyces tetrasporus]KAJ8103196.1 major facilitator superfamily domain-containing protein [Lipomyces tetrasporus]